MEVAGLVIGVVGILPMMVQIVDGCRMISEIKRVKTFMDNLRRDLETEEVTLNQTCEKLLTGIVPAHRFELLRAMEEKDPEWHEYDEQIRARLQEVYEGFVFRAKEIAKVTEELRKKLEEIPIEKTQNNSWTANISRMGAEVKIRARFTMNKKEYTDKIAEICKHNSCLSKLIDHSVSFEPTRQANSRARVAMRVRTVAQGLFSSLRSAMSCHCAESHMFGLHLIPRMTSCHSGAANSKQDDIVSFDLMFGTANSDEKFGKLSVWKAISIRWQEEDAITWISTKQSSESGTSASEPLHSTDENGSTKKGKSSLGAGLGEAFGKVSRSPSRSHKVRFSDTTATISNNGTTSTEAVHDRACTSIVLSPVTDLCADIHQSDMAADHPLGFIPCTEAPTGFELYCHARIPESSNAASLTLREALRDIKNLSLSFEYAERLNIALALSFSVLQLCNTPWLGTVISPDDIIFIRELGSTQYFQHNVDQPSPFLIQKQPKSYCWNKPEKRFNFALLSLGSLLINLMVGCQDSDEDLKETMSKLSLTPWMREKKNMMDRCDDASPVYEEAVEWCFSEGCNFMTLRDENLSRMFYNRVIMKLQHDIDAMNSVW